MMNDHADVVTVGSGNREQLTDSAAPKIYDLLEQKLEELLREEVIVQACRNGGIGQVSLTLIGHGHKHRTWSYRTKSQEVP